MDHQKEMIVEVLKKSISISSANKIDGIDAAAEKILDLYFSHNNPQKHGLSKHPLYRIWTGIKNRCFYENGKGYKDYGGRGITLCQQWQNDFFCFYEWCTNNGWMKGLQIDRYPNNNGNYEPGNIRFVTHRENQRNKRNNRIIKINGVKKTLAEWAELSGLNKSVIALRLESGVSGQNLLKPVVKGIPRMPMHPVLRKKNIDDKWRVYDGERELRVKLHRGRYFVHYKDGQVNINCIPEV